MAVIDNALEFSNAQALGAVSAGSSVVSTDKADLMGTRSFKNEWGTALTQAELGGSEWNVKVHTALVGAAAVVTANLVSKAANASISSGATVIASVTIPALSPAGFKKSVKLTPGTKAYRYLGVLYTVSGAKLTSATMHSYLNLDAETPS